jgi:AraC family ethanolamine operon transcriptional activator
MADPRTERYRQLVTRFEEVARANAEKYAHVTDLCRIADINERTLSRAFRTLLGTGPYRYFRNLRLNEVRRVLTLEDVTVTQAAMRFGFRELGHFGVLYREAFGESPSETRRRIRAGAGASEPETPSLVDDLKVRVPSM